VTYTQLKRSYSAFATSFETQPLATLPPHDQNAVITDPLEYLGGPLRYTSIEISPSLAFIRIVDFKSFKSVSNSRDLNSVVEIDLRNE